MSTADYIFDKWSLPFVGMILIPVGHTPRPGGSE